MRLRDLATGAERVVRARYVSVPTAPAAPSGARSASRCTARTSRPRVSDQFRAPLWQVVEDHRAGIYTVAHPRRRAVPPAGAGRWMLRGGVEPEEAAGQHRGLRPPHPAGAGVPDLPCGSSASVLQLRRAARRPLPRGRRLPRRRRRAPRDAARRHRHEHRDPRRLRPRLEARLGAARLGRRRTCSTATRPSGGPVAEHNARALGRPQRLGPRAGRRAARRPRRPHPARVDATNGERVSTLDLLGPGTHALHRARRRHRAARPPAGRR